MLMMMGSVDGKFTNKDLGTDYEELTNMRQERREQRRRRGRLGWWYVGSWLQRGTKHIHLRYPTTPQVKRRKEKGMSENEALTTISSVAEGSLIQSFDSLWEHGSQVWAAIGWRPTWQLKSCQKVSS